MTSPAERHRLIEISEVVPVLVPGGSNPTQGGAIRRTASIPLSDWGCLLDLRNIGSVLIFPSSLLARYTKPYQSSHVQEGSSE